MIFDIASNPLSQYIPTDLARRPVQDLWATHGKRSLHVWQFANTLDFCDFRINCKCNQNYYIHGKQTIRSH